MYKELVSIIVPVYNQENEVRRCVQSIIRQSYRHIQVLLIDDGSDDCSGKICDELSLQDNRVEVYHIIHGGVSNARNHGLDLALGKYVQFVDGDDYLTFNATEVLVSVMEKKNADLVVCRYMKLIYRLILPNDLVEKEGKYTNKEYLCNTLADPGHHYYGVVWNKLYRNEVIQKYHLRFSSSVTLGEDFIFSLEYLKYISTVHVIKNKLYYYNCENSKSLSRNNEKNIDDCIDELRNRKVIFRKYKESFQYLDLYYKYKKKVYQYWFMYYIRNLYYLKSEFHNWPSTKKQEWYRILNKDLDIKYCMKNIAVRKYVIAVINIRIRSMVVRIVKKILNVK